MAKKLLGYVDLLDVDFKHKIDCRLYTNGDFHAELEIKKNKVIAKSELKQTQKELPRHKVRLYKVYLEEIE